jgi:hypothetical protein
MTLLLAFLTVSAVSQTTPKPKPISNYMREVGLIYIEEVDNLENECMENGHLGSGSLEARADRCDAALDRWDKLFDALERRIDLTLRESRRPAGDIPFFKLLQNTRLGESIFFMTCPPKIRPVEM